MSARKLPVILAPRARTDLSDIVLFIRQHWGRQQQRADKSFIDRALARLGAYPEIGRDRGDLSPGLRSYPVERHVLYYRIRADHVRVLRILHGQQDFADDLDE